MWLTSRTERVELFPSSNQLCRRSALIHTGAAAAPAGPANWEHTHSWGTINMGSHSYVISVSVWSAVLAWRWLILPVFFHISAWQIKVFELRCHGCLFSWLFPLILGNLQGPGRHPHIVEKGNLAACGLSYMLELHTVVSGIKWIFWPYALLLDPRPGGSFYSAHWRIANDKKVSFMYCFQWANRHKSRTFILVDLIETGP